VEEENGENDDLVVCIEMCTNCGMHNWNTRHVESKYHEFFDKSKLSFLKNLVSQKIVERVSKAIVLKNQVPKIWSENDLYNNLIYNADPDCPIYE
jgi:predicted secreted protein